MKILISTCLKGIPCRYDGKSKDAKIIEKYPGIDFVCVCPEVMGGLSTPRNSSERSGDKVFDNQGNDVTKEFIDGANKALSIAVDNDCKVALLKAKSPSCGNGSIYDGTFSGQLIAGDGIFSSLLKENDINVFTEADLDDFEAYLQANDMHLRRT